VRRGWLLPVIAANLAALVVLVFVYPHQMVAPGPLMPAHAELETDCFACHVPMRGAAPARCVACHALPDIGLRTTKGLPIAQATVKASFHQKLIEQDCMACHSDHQGPQLVQGGGKGFSHSLLQTDVREKCETCHAAPANDIHRDLAVGCGQCHTGEAWKPATFEHARLAPAVRESCQSCHTAPVDTLHRQVSGNCGQCHTSERWKPATFDHSKYFVLDGDHSATCATCHIDSNFSSYTCYGCHEHQPAGIRAEHQEEGIANFENCVKCHRSAEEEGEGD
jgi:hypothetical protein